MPNPKLSFTYQDWEKETDLRYWPLRGPELVALDTFVRAYIDTPSDNNLKFLRTAFTRWCNTHGGKSGNWRKDPRNTKFYPFTRLYADLFKEGDTDTAFGVEPFMAPDLVNSRLGLLYLFGKLDCDEGVFKIVTGGVLDMLDAGLSYGSDVGSAGAQNVIGKVQQGLGNGGRSIIEQAAEKADQRAAARHPASTSGSIAIKPEQTRVVTSRELQKPAPPMTPATQRLSDRIFELFRKAWDTAVGVWDEHAGPSLRTLCDFLVGKFLPEAVGATIGGAFDLTSNLISLFESCFNRYKTWVGDRKTELLAGTPTAIVDGIKRAMNLGIAQNLYGTLKSGAQLGMQIASVGASTLVNLVTSIVEVLVKTAWRVFEVRRLKKFFEDARAKWVQRDTLKLHVQPIAFNKWFRHYAVSVPVVSALALNSGLISKMHFLQMFPAVGKEPITQGQYDDGVNHLSHLRGWSADYLREAGYSISSNDPLVSQLIVPGEAEESGLRKHLLNPISSFFEGGEEGPIVTPVLGALGVGG